MKREAKTGDVVAFNLLPDATWYEVVEVNGPLMKVRERGTDYAPHIVDRTLVKQIRDKVQS